jgi:hypothetical protein
VAVAGWQGGRVAVAVWQWQCGRVAVVIASVAVYSIWVAVALAVVVDGWQCGSVAVVMAVAVSVGRVAEWQWMVGSVAVAVWQCQFGSCNSQKVVRLTVHKHFGSGRWQVAVCQKPATHTYTATQPLPQPLPHSK